MTSSPKYWLMKSEPSVYSIDDLKNDKKTCWEGIRNYQARNFMRDEMTIGDEVLFYHSNTDPSGVAGIAKVCKNAYPDPAAWDKKSKYYDSKSSKEKPTWMRVDIGFVQIFRHFVSLHEIKSTPSLKNMYVVRKGMRLSVQPVSKSDFEKITKMGSLSS